MQCWLVGGGEGEEDENASESADRLGKEGFGGEGGCQYITDQATLRVSIKDQRQENKQNSFKFQGNMVPYL